MEVFNEIVLWILSQLLTIVNFILSFFPDLPSFPIEFTNAINYILDLIFDNGIPLLSLFIHINTIKIAVPILIAIINFEYIYKLILWIIHKLPIGVK